MSFCLLLFSTTFNPLCTFLPLAVNLLLSESISTSPRKRVSSIHTSVFHLVLHRPSENTCTKHQYLGSSLDGRGVAWLRDLHELAGEAVMSKPETSQDQNTVRRSHHPQPWQTEELSLTDSYHFRCLLQGNWSEEESQDGCLP